MSHPRLEKFSRGIAAIQRRASNFRRRAVHFYQQHAIKRSATPITPPNSPTPNFPILPPASQLQQLLYARQQQRTVIPAEFSVSAPQSSRSSYDGDIEDTQDSPSISRLHEGERGEEDNEDLHYEPTQAMFGKRPAPTAEASKSSESGIESSVSKCQKIG